jgi:aminodeoxyfutalosine deaminase
MLAPDHPAPESTGISSSTRGGELPIADGMFGVEQGRVIRYDAAAAVDAEGFSIAPASVLVLISQAREDDRVASGTRRDSIQNRTPGTVHSRRSSTIDLLDIGPPRRIDHHPLTARAERIDLGPAVILPALVNAHTHLDLTGVGPRPFDASLGFAGWIDLVRRARPTDPAEIDRATSHGIELSRLGGVSAVGDIAGAPMGVPTATAGEILARSGMFGISFVEFFGMGDNRERGLARAIEARDRLAHAIAVRSGLLAGLSPHATNTIAPDVYQRVLAMPTTPASTHLAESPEEREFITRGTGPQRELLERVGVWDDSILRDVGRGLSPVAHFVDAVRRTPDLSLRDVSPWILAHVNDCSDDDLDLLGDLRRDGFNLHVAYCPRASAYFRAADHFGPHRFADMLRRAIPVALGTDSIINLPPDSLTHGISTWDEMRLLHGTKDNPLASRSTDSRGATLLRMATVNGASALGLTRSSFTLSAPGRKSGLLAVSLDREPNKSLWVEAAIESSHRPFLL